MTYLETGVYRLSTLSPIHIRAGEPNLYGQGFLRLNNTDNFLYVVDTLKLQTEIFACGGVEAVNTYTEAFSNPNSKTNIAKVLNQIGYDYKSNIKKISKGIVRLSRGNRFIQSGLGEHFIPGSSIKGAIKTAVLFYSVRQRIVEENFDLNDFVENQIANNVNKRDFAISLLRNAFHSSHPQEPTPNPQRWNEPKGPFTDIFKAIKVKDAIIKETSIDPSQFAKTIKFLGAEGFTLKTLDSSEIQLPLDKAMKNLTGGGNLTSGVWIQIDSFAERDGKQIVATFTKVDEPTFSRVEFEDIFFTTLQGNQVVEKEMDGDTRFECFHGETTIEISIDHEILDSFKRGGAILPFSDLNSLIKLCQDSAQAQWESEQQFHATHTSGEGFNLDRIKTFYADTENKNRATLRVGWGTGMLGTTVSLLLDEDTRVRLRNEVISNGQHIRPRPAPKSRRFVLENNQPAYPLGWIELREE